MARRVAVPRQHPSRRRIIPVDTVVTEPSLLCFRHLAHCRWSNGNLAGPQAALPADVDSGLVAMLQDELLVMGRPSHQHAAATGRAGPLLGTGLGPAVEYHLVSCWHRAYLLAVRGAPRAPAPRYANPLLSVLGYPRLLDAFLLVTRLYTFLRAARLPWSPSR